jgi:hypothetical protein
MRFAPRPLKDFYVEFLARLSALGIEPRIWPVPVETIEAVPFTEDDGHSDYCPEVAERLHAILLIADRELRTFCSGFLGKTSPVHLFWGGFDLAVTRFSGRPAPQHPGGIPHLADWVTREAYSHEVASFGFWPGTAGAFERPAFYAYAYPEPPGYSTAAVRPSAVSYRAPLKEYLLPYDDVRTDRDPAAAVQLFLQSTYEAAADLGRWDRAALERPA